ncbi:hypothetical protein HZC09_00880 [Candidatus Micrarchaeota archaeon]|nr:hypothetical protein [Candidatus Micrarchaeota archaeon]
MPCFDIKFKIKRDGKFWFIEAISYPVFTQGKTRAEAIDNFKDAFKLYAQDLDAQCIHPELKRLFEYPKTDRLSVPQVVSLAIPLPPLVLSSAYEPPANSIWKSTNQTPV